MFWRKRAIQSKEYLELFEKIEKLRIKLEMFEISLDLTKKKLKVKKGLIDEEEKNIYSGVILPEDGSTQ